MEFSQAMLMLASIEGEYEDVQAKLKNNQLAMEQLADVLDAYTSLDTQKALDVWHNDSRIDTLYNSVFRELLTYMMEDARTIGMCTHLLFGAKNIERIGDHACNIAEHVVYLVRGLDVRHGRLDELGDEVIDPE